MDKCECYVLCIDFNVLIVDNGCMKNKLSLFWNDWLDRIVGKLLGK